MIQSQEVQKHFKNIERPLSLLFRHMDISNDNTSGPEESRSEPSAYKKNKSTPASLTELCRQLEENITQKSRLFSICHEEQQALIAVLISELGMIWQDLKSPSVDTTLTHQENAQLHCQTFSEVLCICERLFLHYLHTMKTLKERGVFTDYANRSRLGAQLASDCTNLLNVRVIKRSIVAAIKATRRDEDVMQRERQQRPLQTHSQPSPRKQPMFLNADHRIKRTVTCRPREKTVEDELTEIQENIGDLDLQRVYDLLPCHMEPFTIHKTETHCPTGSMGNKQKPEKDPSPYQNQVIRMKGCHSMPDLQSETLLEELDIAPPSRPPSPLVLLYTDPSFSLKEHLSPAEDLKRLLQDREYEDDTNLSDCETDLPPLIKAMSSNDSSRLHQLKERLQKMIEKEEKMRKSKVHVEQAPHPQAAAVSVAVSAEIIMRTAAARVSNIVLPETMKLSICPPVYNDLTKEIDSASVAQMDRNLFDENMGIRKVYEELSKTISAKYFSLDEDPRIEPVITNSTSCTTRKINQKLINQSLRRSNPFSISHRERTEMFANRKKPVDVTARAYRAWQQWWKSELSLDDYLNYISNQDSDYLSVIFHLYDSEDEEEERENLAKQEREKKRRMQQERINSLRRQKEEYVPGFWNVNTIEMGGLGREPELSEKNLCSLDEAIQDVTVCHGEDSDSPDARLLNREHLQARLERVWSSLCLPEGQRLDMAIKYSCHEHKDSLLEALMAWEQAARFIQQREILLSRLEQFERVASDPNRFFQRGSHGSSIARMEEANQREKLNCQISAVDKELTKTIGHITSSFNDTITYKGRPYSEKMRWDRIEMLYWLQQERRIQSLGMFVEARTAPPARLPPLNQSQEICSDTHQTLQHCVQQSPSDCERNSQ